MLDYRVAWLLRGEGCLEVPGAATWFPVASWVARATSPNPAPPSSRSSAQPGTDQVRPDSAATGPGASAVGVDIGGCPSLSGAEDLQGDLPRKLARALERGGHVDRRLPGGDRLAQRVRRARSRPHRSAPPPWAVPRRRALDGRQLNPSSNPQPRTNRCDTCGEGIQCTGNSRPASSIRKCRNPPPKVPR
jgi:hypothetical protein